MFERVDWYLCLPTLKPQVEQYTIVNKFLIAALYVTMVWCDNIGGIMACSYVGVKFQNNLLLRP